jgi:hypothetical protein
MGTRGCARHDARGDRLRSLKDDGGGGDQVGDSPTRTTRSVSVRFIISALDALLLAGSASADVKLGAFVLEHDGRSRAVERNRIETALGRKLGVERHYVPPGKEFPSGYVIDSARDGRLQVLSFSAPSSMRWRRVANGGYDRSFRASFRKLKANYPLLKSMVLIYENEPDQSRKSYKGSPANYRAAYRHVHRLARSVGVTNRWSTALSEWTWYARNPSDWMLPFLTFVGVDIYGVSVFECGAQGWQSFHHTTIRPYRWIASHGKKMLIAELGIREDLSRPSRKAKWFEGMRSAVKDMPALKIIAYSHTDFGGPCSYRRGYWIDSSWRSRRAFRAMALDSYFHR